MTGRSDVQERARGLDNRLALDQLILRCAAVGIGWSLIYEHRDVSPACKYELSLFSGPAEGIYHGRTATHAATQAMAELDEHKVGWDG